MQEDEFGFVPWQDFRRYVEAVGDLIQDYITYKDGYDGWVLAINDDDLTFDLKQVDELAPNDVAYELSKLTRVEDGEECPDYEAIEDIADKYIFVR